MQSIKGLLAALFFFYWLGEALAQAPSPDIPAMTWRLVEVRGADQAAQRLMAGAGIEIVGKESKGGLQALVNRAQQQWLDSLGLFTRVLIEDYGRWLAERNRAEAGLAAPQDLADGSLGGYFSPQEILAFVDSLIAGDTHGIISDTMIIGFSTWQNPLWVVKISAAPNADQDLPEVFFNSLIHAREAMSGMVLLYFMRYLVDNYGVTDSVTDLVDSRELYFMPLVNPDGYQINWDNYRNTGGFGLWRKNARDNNNNGALDQLLDGVDLNRNFPFQWGNIDFDYSSSSNPGSDSYRGASAASEPETKALIDFINKRSFTAAINLHTYSAVLINPFNYRDLRTPDSLLYDRLAGLLTAGNGYGHGNAIETLGYPANGELTDWEYADSASRGKIMSWTGEIGATKNGFWPARTEIPLEQKKNLAMLADLAKIAGFWPTLDSLAQVRAQPDSSRLHLRFRLSNLGILPNREKITVRLKVEAGGEFNPQDSVSPGDLSVAAVPPSERDSLLVDLSGSSGYYPAALEVYEGGRKLRSFAFQLKGNLSPFDLTRDGKTNIFDLLDMLRILASDQPTGADWSAYDLNHDGKVTVLDLIVLLKDLAKK